MQVHIFISVSFCEVLDLGVGKVLCFSGPPMLSIEYILLLIDFKINYYKHLSTK